jgi:hypothetical protein
VDVKFGSEENFFRAGAFTYMLTRYLWQQSGNQGISESFNRLALSTRTVDRKNSIPQDPVHEVSPTCPPSGPPSDQKTCDRQPIYFLSPDTPSAEAVISQVDGQVNGQVEFWMGGISSQSLDARNPGATYNLLTVTGDTIGTIEQTGRQGLMGTGKVIEGGPAIAGMLLREKIRGVPANLALSVALDPSLGSQTVAAQAALDSVSRVEVVDINGTNEIDYIFGPMGREAREQANEIGMTNLPPDGSLCLFTTGPALVPGSWHPDFEPETVTEAIDRLRSRFKMLLANRILKAVLNTDTSDVKVEVNVTQASGRGSLSRFGSRGAAEAGTVDQALPASTQILSANSEISIDVANNEDRGLYIAVVVISSSGDLGILHPLDAAEASALVAPETPLSVPVTVEGPAGFLELLVIASTSPLRDALRALEQVATRSGGSQFVSLDADEAVDVVESLLQDLDENSRSGGGYDGPNRGVDTTQLAAISAVFEVVE